MPKPREVFEEPSAFWGLITACNDAAVEGQCFDRKEAGRPGPTGICTKGRVDAVQDAIQATVSAFANSNPDGGLLVIGVSKSGEVFGVDHLNDQQRMRLLGLDNYLVNHAVEVKEFVCPDGQGNQRTVWLIFVPCTQHAICESRETSPKAWVRQGAQNVPMSESQRERLRRDKRIVDFERAICCTYDPGDIDRDVLSEFRASFLSEAGYDFTDEQLLYQAGAIEKDGDGYAFTNAGLLFFAANPQRVLPASFVRLLRFEAGVDQFQSPGLPTFDRPSSGPISKQIRDLRSFFQQSGFFKTYQRRNPDGGFTEDPEYPMIAVDEAIVNAVAHRDYAVKLPIECLSYRDALVVRNPGRILQRNTDVRERFSLSDTVLDSMPRNSLLIEWLKRLRDQRGTTFVRALSEGTRRMRDEMIELGLPAPEYYVSASDTILTLYSLAGEREAALRAESEVPADEFTNLFPVKAASDIGPVRTLSYLNEHRREFVAALGSALEVHGWYVDSVKHGRLVAHRRGMGFGVPDSVRQVVRFFPAYSFQLRQYWDRCYLCVDYSVEVKSVQTVHALLDVLASEDLIGKRAAARIAQGWTLGRVVAIEPEWVRVYLFDYGRDERVRPDEVIPNLPLGTIQRLLDAKKITFDVHRATKQYALSLEPNAARIRIERTQATVTDLSRTVFPLTFGGITVNLAPTPTPLTRHPGAASALRVYTLPEPSVEFGRQRESANIREGMTTFGSYDGAPRDIEIIPVCTDDQRDNMASLIERLRLGKYKYKGAERTFSTRLGYGAITTATEPGTVLNECQRLLSQRPELAENAALNRIFLVHTPEAGYSADDERSPYFVVKRFLLERGVPCQMVDTPTLVNPDWKDLNLALNLVAKCGGVPWVLPDAVPDADFFVGLSYTQNVRRSDDRLMAFANVFNHYGRWMFYSGSTETFPFEDRITHYRSLVRRTLEQLTLSETPSIHFHYSAKFSRDAREAILEAARSVRPLGTYTFVWINTHHNVRLYDSRPETDGSLSRGSYVPGSPNQILLSTTGYNPYRRSLGTPHMLEVNVRIERPEGKPEAAPDLRSLAVQILSLTKLNWKSTDSVCGEPITTKYAGDIAGLTAAFLRQGRPFRLHPVLERTPWFV